MKRPGHVALLTILGVTAGCAPPAASIADASSPVPPESPVSTSWIEVVLSEQTAYLWEGDALVASLPIASGVGSSPESTTYTGEFRVQSMYSGPEETAPGVFVRDVLIFDWAHGNGFHSLPMDVEGSVLDATVGTPASAGCVRVRDSALLYGFAHVGMKVVIR